MARSAKRGTEGHPKDGEEVERREQLRGSLPLALRRVKDAAPYNATAAKDLIRLLTSFASTFPKGEGSDAVGKFYFFAKADYDATLTK